MLLLFDGEGLVRPSYKGEIPWVAQFNSLGTIPTSKQMINGHNIF